MKRPRLISPHYGGYLIGTAYQNADKTIPHQNPIRLNAKGAVLLYGADIQEVRDINNNVVNLPLDDGYCYFVDKYGKPLKNGKVYTYYYQSTRPKKSYGDENRTVVNDNPIVLDELGRAKIYINGNYRLRIYDENGVCMGDDDDFGVPLFARYELNLTSLKYPKFVKKYLDLTSLIYPMFNRVELNLTSRIYPHWQKRYLNLTSLNYPYIDEVLLQVGVKPVDIIDIQRPIEVLNIKGVTPLDITSHSIVKQYNQPLEDILIVAIQPIDIAVNQIVKQHNQPLEDILMVTFQPLDIISKTIVIRHHQPLEDILTVSFQPLDII